jgi:hypothetical protein
MVASFELDLREDDRRSLVLGVDFRDRQNNTHLPTPVEAAASVLDAPSTSVNE